jgi:hypothetical protein
MDFLITIFIGFGAGLLVGWMVLPAPKFVQDFWVRMGWAEKPPEVIVEVPAPPPLPVASVSKAKAAVKPKRKK